MRAARLLHILLLLQNRGRLSSAALARELEVAPRTILRDIDALTEAGLPVVTYQGNRGGFELGFNYRTRLTGLAEDEAEALAIILAAPAPYLDDLGIALSARRAVGKLVESLPDKTRATVSRTQERFGFSRSAARPVDPRVAAPADAVRRGVIVRLRARSASPATVHPCALRMESKGWALVDARDDGRSIPDVDWGDINISSLRY